MMIARRLNRAVSNITSNKQPASPNATDRKQSKDLELKVLEETNVMI